MNDANKDRPNFILMLSDQMKYRRRGRLDPKSLASIHTNRQTSRTNPQNEGAVSWLSRVLERWWASTGGRDFEYHESERF